MNDRQPKFLMDIAASIDFTLKNGHITASLILTYSAIDCMASLIMPADQKDVTGRDFINWVDTYMKTDPDQPYQYQGKDLWGARCGLVHRYSPHSRFSDNGECKVFQYHNGGDHIYNQSINKNVVMISAPRLIEDFYGAMDIFLKELQENNELRDRANKREKTLFRVMPYKD